MTLPVLLLHGSADTLIPADHGKLLARTAQNATLVLLPGIGHELAYRPDCQAEILAWLRALRL